MTPYNHEHEVESMGLICYVVVITFHQTTIDLSFLQALLLLASLAKVE
jgi:hypothetical protein